MIIASSCKVNNIFIIYLINQIFYRDISTAVGDLQKQFSTVISKNKEIQNLFDKRK